MSSRIEREASREARELFAALALQAEAATRPDSGAGACGTETATDRAGEAPGSVDIEAAVTARPELESELRGLHAGWLRLGRLLGSIRVDSSVLSSLAHEASRSSEPADPELEAIVARLGTARTGRERYEVLERIATGGMGEVYRVHDRDLGRDLAMKIARSRWSGPRDLRRFLGEARLTAGLEHPGIVPVHDLGVDAEGRLWFTMPLVRGSTLEAILAHARPEAGGGSRARLLETLLRMCDTLAFAHAAGVVHRDLKPSNVIVGDFGEVYVVDWGLARFPGAVATETSEEIVGTPSYMAPEQALPGTGSLDARADVYSIGAILYHVLSGHRPFAEQESSTQILAALRAGGPTPLEDRDPATPPDLVSICERAMARDPRARYASVQALSRDLRAWTEGRVVRTYERGAWAELRKWVARNTPLAAALASALLLALTGLAAVSWVQARAKSEILELADVRRLEDLEARAETLWPATPEKVPAMEAWLADANALLERLPRHTRSLVDASSESLDAEARWKHDVLTGLVDGLSRLGDPDPSKGLIADVRNRWSVARTLRARSLEEQAGDWDAAVGSIRDPRACPSYGGLSIAPQLGLVPLGRDPKSGLWEFAHLPSGEPARRDEGGSLVVEGRTGLVLVLVPGGTFDMGSQAPVPGQRPDGVIDPLARENETPAHAERVSPYFLSKFEMTRAQWRRALGERTETGSAEDLLPAEGLSRPEAERILRHLGLALPDEIQWEYAARAGTRTRWWPGNDARALVGAENAGFGIDASFPYEDGWPDVAPATSLQANPWGFHHVLGNVAEWTAGAYGMGLGTVRGGSFRSSVRDLRAASRTGVPVENRSTEIGLRPARALEPRR